ncbi:hypothetical protein ERO13_D11G256300v2 [Gossypium hirsutum]|nr:hypothetical protein ERO13_D11G256300v2 [Gossypium hirsutum]
MKMINYIFVFEQLKRGAMNTRSAPPPPRERTDLPLQWMPWLEASKTHIQSKKPCGGVGAVIAEKFLSGTHLVLGENMDWLVLLQQHWIVQNLKPWPPNSELTGY